MQVVDIVGIFQEDPKQIHIPATKKILRYGLCYPRDKDLSLNIYTDVDWVGDVYYQKRTCGTALFLEKCIVS